MTFYMLVEKNDALNTSEVAVYRDFSKADEAFKRRLSACWDAYLGKYTKTEFFRGLPYTDSGGRSYKECMKDHIFVVSRKEGTFSYEMAVVDEGTSFQF